MPGFNGIPIKDCQKAALKLKKKIDFDKRKTRYLTRTFRFSETDIQNLKQVAKKYQTPNMTETIRVLIQKAVLSH